MKNYALFLLLVFVGLSACRDDVDRLIIDIDEDPPLRFVQSTIIGRVIDEAGDPLANAVVSIGNEEIRSGSGGNFEFINLEVLSSGDVITAEANGYYTGVSQSNFQAEGKSYVEIKVLDKGLPETISSTTDNLISQPDGLEVSIPANSLVTANGQRYTGNVNVFSKWIDPTDEDLGDIMPGALIATDQDNQDVVLATFGMLALDLEAANGAELFIAENANVEAKIPIPAELLGDAPDEIPLWEFDLEEGKWLEDGKCEKEGSSYTCKIPKTGYWNCDIPLEGICLSVQVFNQDLSPAPFLNVIIEDLTNNFIYSGRTDLDGFLCGNVPKSAPLKLTILDHCENVLFMEEIGVFDDDARLEDIILDTNVEVFIVNVLAGLASCTSTDIPQGHIGISFPGFLQIFPIEDGTLDRGIAFICSDFPEIEFTLYNNTEPSRSITQSVLAFGDVDLGTLSTCEDLDDSFTFMIDDESLFAAPTQYFFKPNQTSEFLVLEGQSARGTVTIELSDYQGVGMYETNATFNTISLSQLPQFEALEGASPSITVEVTMDDGSFISGNFTGTAINDFNEQRSISGDFKLKKAP